MNIFLKSVIGVLTKILPCKQFKLGDGYVNRYTFFEQKGLFSFYLHEIATNCQDRFHTHAFDAWAYCLNGGYIDEVKDNIGDISISKFVNIKKGSFRYIPRMFNHRLTKALPDTYTLLFCGPYSTLWTEEFDDGRIDLLTTHREVIKSVKVVS